MDRPRKVRYLRVAVSAVCLTACMLLIVLWVRSYETADRLHGRVWAQSFLLVSKAGRVAFVLIPRSGGGNGWQWEGRGYPVDDGLSLTDSFLFQKKARYPNGTRISVSR